MKRAVPLKLGLNELRRRPWALWPMIARKQSCGPDVRSLPEVIVPSLLINMIQDVKPRTVDDHGKAS